MAARRRRQRMTRSGARRRAADDNHLSPVVSVRAELSRPAVDTRAPLRIEEREGGHMHRRARAQTCIQAAAAAGGTYLLCVCERGDRRFVDEDGQSVSQPRTHRLVGGRQWCCFASLRHETIIMCGVSRTFNRFLSVFIRIVWGEGAIFARQTNFCDVNAAPSSLVRWSVGRDIITTLLDD